LFETQEVCTHKRPNKVQIVSASHDFAFAQEDVYNVSLQDNYVATATVNGQSVNGTWSPIYDQAMRVKLDNGLIFITNFRYNIRPDLSPDPVSDGASKFVGTKAGDYASFDSDCSQTMVGFVQQSGGSGTMKNHPVQCFYGQQVKAANLA
jgi:hypothetical protein